MGQTRKDDTRTELSRPGEPGLTTRMVEKGIQQQQTHKSYLHKIDAKSHASPLCPFVTPTHHLISCIHIRQALFILDLWADPAGVAKLLVRFQIIIVSSNRCLPFFYARLFCIICSPPRAGQLSKEVVACSYSCYGSVVCS